MVELVHKRGWDSKVFDTGKVEAGTEAPIFGTLLQNGLHDKEPDGSFVECDTLFRLCTDGVSTNKAGRTRCGEVRISDTADESKQLAKVKSKELEGISLKLQGHRTYGPDLPTLREAVYSTYDGITVRQFPNYKGINIVLEIANPQTASNVYQFTVKEYGCTYTYEEINGDIKCISSSGKSDIWIKALYAKDANDDCGNVSLRLGNKTVEGYQVIEKVIDPVWLGNAVGPVEIDPSVTIDDDTGTLIDMFISSNVPNNNFGVYITGQVQNVAAARQSSFLQVDLTGYLGVTATLARFGVDIYTGGFNIDVAWHRVLKDWIEGTKNNAAASAGEPTYNSQKHSEALWATAGCLGDGTDRQASAEGTATITGTSSDYHFDLTLATVQAWLDNASNNNGIMVTAPNLVESKNITYRSSEASLGNKPYFYMEYTEGGGGSFPFFFDIGHY